MNPAMDTVQAPSAFLLSPEAQELWDRVNGAATDRPPATLARLFLARAQETPDRPAVIASSATLSYRELALRAGAVVGRLDGSPVGVCVEPGWEQVVAVTAAVLAGAPFVAVGPAAAASARWQRLSLAGASTVLTQSWLDERLDWPEGSTRIALDRTDPLDAPPPEPAALRPQDVATVLVSDGGPVALTHDAIAGGILDLAERLGMGGDDRVLAVSPLGDEVALFAVLAPLLTGGAVVIPDDIDLRTPAVWVDLIRREDVTVWHSPPALAGVLAEHLQGRGDEVPPSLRLVLLGSEPLPLSLVRRLRALGGQRLRIVNLGAGGPLGPWSTMLEVGEPDARRGHLPIGTPLANRRVHVLSDAMAPCPVWVTGAVYLGGRGLPPAGGERFVDTGFGRLYRTDLTGRLLPDGTVDVVGDAGTRITVQNHPLNLREVEAALATHEAVLGAAVVPSGAGSVGYVRAVPGAQVTGAALLDHLRRRMSPYLLPERIELVSSFPLTPGGRVDRSVLAAMAAPVADPAAPAGGRGNGDTGGVTAPEELVRQACELAARILGVAEVDPLMNLLDLGATSVQLVRLAVQAEQELGICADVEELLRFPSVTVLVSFAEVPVEDSAEAAPVAEVGSGELILDPDERDAFKARKVALRRDLDGELAVELGRSTTDGPVLAARRTHRAFAAAPVPLSALADLLGALRRLPGRAEGADVKYGYPSAGSLYPVQAYLTVAPARVAGLAAGSYYYDPAGHRLVRVDPDAELPATAHAWINRAAFRSSAFSVYLVACYPAVAPMYGQRARDYALIEAGAMCQLLMTRAAGLGLGLCPVGELDVTALRGFLRVGGPDEHEVLHTLLGGVPSDEAAMLERLDRLEARG